MFNNDAAVAGINLPDCYNVRLLCTTLTLLHPQVISVTIHHSYKNTHTHQIMQPKKFICEDQAQANLTITLILWDLLGKKIQIHLGHW